jgi:hypothetical protein
MQLKTVKIEKPDDANFTSSGGAWPVANCPCGEPPKQVKHDCRQRPE